MNVPQQGALLFVLFIGLVSAAVRAEHARPEDDDAVVELPPLIVEERITPLRWRYLKLPELEILSVCDDSVTEEFVLRQLRLEELLRVLLPERFRVRLSVPEAHILFGEETGRANAREVIAEMAQREGARVAADGTVILPFRAGGLRPHDQRRVRILPNIRLDDSDAVRVFAVADGRTSGPMDFTFAKARIAFLLSRRTPVLPDWLIEGMLALYAQTRFDVEAIEFHPLVWISEEESRALAQDSDQPRTLLPMAELFAAQHPASGGSASTLAPIWRAQSALFVRWALAGADGARREALWQWLERMDHEPASEAAFRACFGIGYSDARDRLSDYLSVAVSQQVRLAAPRTGPLPRIQFRAATDLEVARIRGDWERLQVQYVRQHFPSLTEKYSGQARRTVLRAYDRGERDPQLLAVLGLMECDAGAPLVAREYLEAAVQGNVVRPRVYFELARIRYNDLQGKGPGHRLTATEAQSVLVLLLRARSDAPPLPEVYSLIVDVWLRSERPPSQEDLAVIGDGVRLFPALSPLVMRAIQVHVSAGSLGTALEFAETGLSHARNPEARTRFQQARAEIAAARK